MILKKETTGKSVEVYTPEEAYDAFCALSGCDGCEQTVDGDDLEFLSEQVIDSEKEYRTSQELYTLITEAKNEQIVLANKLDKIAEIQQSKVAEDFNKLQEVSKAFNEAYEASEYSEDDELGEDNVDCDNECEDCGYEECPDRTTESKIEKSEAPYNTVKSSFKLNDKFCELEARFNAPVTESVLKYLINKLEKQITKE